MKVSFQFKLTKQWKGKCIITSVESSLVHPILAAENIQKAQALNMIY